MSGIRNPVYYPFLAGGTINPNTIVKIGAADQTVIQATAAADQPVGVAAIPANTTAASGERVDVVIGGVMEIKVGAAGIARGARVASDANGLAVAAAPGAGTNNGIVGVALETGASGDLVAVLLSPGVMQG